MFWILLGREIQEGFSSHLFFLALLFLSLLIPLSAYSQARHHEQMVADFNLRRQIHEAENNYQAAVLTRPIPSFLPFCNGDYESLPNEVILRSDSVSKLPASEDVQPIDAILPQTDLSLIIGVLLTLMAILLAHDTISGERRRGTLKLIVSITVARGTLVMAKIAGVAVIMLTSLIYAVVLYAAIIFLVDRENLAVSSSTIGGIALLLLVGILAILEFIVLGVAVSTMVRRSPVSLAICLAIWVALVLLWPSLSPYLVSAWEPASPGQVHRRRVLAIEAEMIRGELAEHQKAAAELRGRQGNIESGWEQYVSIKRAWGDRKLQETASINSPRDQLLERQRRTASGLIWLSPYGGLTDVFGVICATGATDYELFSTEVDRYYRDAFLPAVYDSMTKETPWRPDQVSTAPFKPLPFEMPSVSMGERLKYAAWPVSLILAETILLIIICLIGIRRYDVR